MAAGIDPVAHLLLLLHLPQGYRIRDALSGPTSRPIISGQLHVTRHPSVTPRVSPGLPVAEFPSPYSAACSTGAVRGRIICTRVPPPGSESRSSRPPKRFVTMLYTMCRPRPVPP